MSDRPLQREAWWNDGSLWRGSAEQLIAAAIVRREQLPGYPGNGKTMVTFIDGKRATRSQRGWREAQHYMQIVKAGRRFIVMVRGSDGAFTRFLDRVLAPDILHEAEGEEISVEKALEVLGAALLPLDEMARRAVCSGLAILPEHLDLVAKVARTIAALGGQQQT